MRAQIAFSAIVLAAVLAAAAIAGGDLVPLVGADVQLGAADQGAEPSPGPAAQLRSGGTGG